MIKKNIPTSTKIILVTTFIVGSIVLYLSWPIYGTYASLYGGIIQTEPGIDNVIIDVSICYVRNRAGWIKLLSYSVDFLGTNAAEAIQAKLNSQKIISLRGVFWVDRTINITQSRVTLYGEGSKLIMASDLTIRVFENTSYCVFTDLHFVSVPAFLDEVMKGAVKIVS